VTSSIAAFEAAKRVNPIFYDKIAIENKTKGEKIWK